MPEDTPPPAEAEVKAPSQASSPRFRWAVIGGAAFLLVAIGVGVAVAKSKPKAGATTVVRDVPRMEGNTIVFSNAFRDRVGLTFAKAEKTPFKPTIKVVGTVAFNPSYVAAIGTRLRGTVRRTFKFEGDHVKVGEALAEVESAELGEAQAGVTQAEVNVKAAEIQAKREKELLDKSLTTAREAEVAAAELATRKSALQAAQQRSQAYGGGGGFGLYVLKTPIAGHVIERHIAPGQSVDGATVGYKVADLDHLWVELSIFERDLEAVKIDDDVDISPVTKSSVKLPGKVAHVGEVIDPVSRSTEVRIAVDNPKVHLRPGQSVEATITSGVVEREALLIPHASVVYVDGKSTVFVKEGDGRVRATPVKLGASDGNRHEVLEGVQAGQEVASSGVFALKSELFR